MPSPTRCSPRAAAARRVINRDKNICKVAGTRERRETPTPAGICSHVKAP